MNNYNFIDDTTFPPLDAPPAAASIDNKNEHFHSMLATESVSDLVHAEMFAELYRHELTFVPAWGWMRFNGKYWEGGEHDVLGMAGEVIRMRIEAHRRMVDPAGEKGSRPLNKLERYSNERHLRGMLSLAESMLHTSATRFDADPYLLAGVSRGRNSG